MFYSKLALANLRRNKRIFLPFLLSMIFLVVINIVMQVIIHNDGMNSLYSADAALQMFTLGNYIIIIFTIIFSLYTNSFLLKQRKKELGLYNILGMGKKELAWTILWESVYSYLITVVFGILIGNVFSRLCFLVLMKMSGFGKAFHYQFPFISVLNIGILFLCIYLLLFSWNFLQLKFVNPIDLFKGGQTGEKEPKTKWLTAILGIGCVGTGYYISVTISSPLQSISFFFIAVILVIIGTYAIFIASSIAILKILKKNKKFYYQSKHFISISSMIYRMKQNAAGLASICVLCTMVLVTIATTSSLYFGTEDLLASQHTFDLSITTTDDAETIQSSLVELADKSNVTVTEQGIIRSSQSFMVKHKEDTFTAINPDQSLNELADMNMMILMTQEEYQKQTKKRISLQENETWLYSSKDDYHPSAIQFGKQSYKIAGAVKKDDVPFLQSDNGLTGNYLLVVDSEKTIQSIIGTLYPIENYPDYQVLNDMIYIDFTGEKEERIAYATNAKNYVESVKQELFFSSIDLDREDIQTFTGGFLFLGIIFGLTFTLATGIIIYYKQISEGTQDQDRYDIMQRVGMSHQEVKKTIHSQILMVFFFPIALASLHLAFAFPVIQKMLLLFGLNNQQFFMIVCAVTVTCFFIIYLLMYWQTSKAYYRIVERKAGVYGQ